MEPLSDIPDYELEAIFNMGFDRDKCGDIVCDIKSMREQLAEVLAKYHYSKE